MSGPPRCRLCEAPLTRTFVDLGHQPPCESFLTAEALALPEVTYPLHVRVCDACLLVQLPEVVRAGDVFADPGGYAYFSSYSDSWVAHAGAYVATMVAGLGLGPDSLVTEVASNDGYLLRHLVDRGIPVLGVEPAANVAAAALERGVRTEVVFLGEATGRALAAEHGRADLVVANNVLAHVPDLRDFVLGLRALVADDGLVTLEFPHLLRLVAGRQFDTIYHEHYSYLSLRTATAALATGGLEVVDVEELGTHGGSLRVHARPAGAADAASAAVGRVLAGEAAAGLHTPEGHDGFDVAVTEVRLGLLGYLLDAARAGRQVAGYGAPGKGNTLLNTCGVRADLIAYTVDRNPGKHGRYLPGSHLPVHPVDRLRETRPDDVLILPWNLREEIAGQLAWTAEWGARLAVPVPGMEFV